MKSKKLLVLPVAVIIAVAGITFAMIGNKPVTTSGQGQSVKSSQATTSDTAATTEQKPVPTQSENDSAMTAPVLSQSDTSTTSAQPSGSTSGSTDSSSSSATQALVTVKSYRAIVVSDNQTDCEVTYTDGTTYRWAWRVTNPQGAWVKDGEGQNGHWQPTTTVNGRCDDSLIGQVKAN